jgi:hypothetical protein
MNDTLKQLWWAGILAAPLLALGPVGQPGPALAEEDDEGMEEPFERTSRSGEGQSASAAMDPLYAEECGACHVPYPAWALPARSWEKMMGNLADHFGDNAELPAETAAEITRYLKVGAGDAPGRGEAGEFLRGVGRNDAPQRITELASFKREHREIPRRVYRDNPDLKLAQCDACHTRAAQGSYRERDINIPGLGRWED